MLYCIIHIGTIEGKKTKQSSKYWYLKTPKNKQVLTVFSICSKLNVAGLFFVNVKANYVQNKNTFLFGFSRRGNASPQLTVSINNPRVRLVVIKIHRSI